MAVLASWITRIFKLYSLNVCYITFADSLVFRLREEPKNTNTLKHLLVLINSLRDGSLRIIFLFNFFFFLICIHI